MYTNIQQQAHIRELQGLLHGISYYNPAVPRIIPDGIYGRETEAAVRAFQQYYGLRVTGETNQATWDRIVIVYRELVDQPPQPLRAFPQQAGAVMLPGEQGFPILIIQSILHSLSEKYGDVPPVKVTGEFDSDTQRAIQPFQKMCALPMTGCVDCKTWNLLAQAGGDLL